MARISSDALTYCPSTNQSVVIRPSARPSRSGAIRTPLSLTYGAKPATPSVTSQGRLPGAWSARPSVRTTRNCTVSPTWKSVPGRPSEKVVISAVLPGE